MTDKYDIVFDLIEHPDRYSDGQIGEILADPEAREIYNLLCKSTSAMTAGSDAPDVDAEWERFALRTRRPRLTAWFGSRAASIVVLVVSTVTALAIGVAVTVTVVGHKEDVPVAGRTYEQQAIKTEAVQEIAEPEADDATDLEPVVFEDESLRDILDVVCRRYGVTARYGDEKTAGLHLFFRFDPALSLDEVIEQLNTFEQINIVRSGNTLTIN